MSKSRKGRREELAPTPFAAVTKDESPKTKDEDCEPTIGEGQIQRGAARIQKTGAAVPSERLEAQRLRNDSAMIREASIDEDPPASVDLSAMPLHEMSADQRYSRERALGEGGMGEILLVHDERLRRKVALKRMRADATSDEGRARFLREGRIQAQLEHPNIVPVYDMGIGLGGASYFTMRRVHGRTLGEIIEALREGDTTIGTHFGTHKLLNIFCSVCLTLEFAHSHGVVHRDLKPDNVMLGEFGEVNVLDWGLAKVAGEREVSPSELATALGKKTPSLMDVRADGASPTVVGAVMGTPGFMAPEQVRGELDRVGPEADVYALGSILFEILTLQPLHDVRGGSPKMISTLDGADARARARAPERDVALELERICIKATASEPEDRFRSARALCDEVQNYLEGELDLQRRLALAKRHADEAEQVLSSPAGEYVEARAKAARHLRSALAFDPSHRGALDAMMRLLVELPKDVPPEAEQALFDKRMSDRDAVRKAVLTVHVVILLLAIPMQLWIGVRSWLVFALFNGALMGLCAAVGFAGGGVQPKGLGFIVAAYCLVLAAMSVLAAPLAAPAFAAAYGTLLLVSTRASGKARKMMLFGSLMALLLPGLAQLHGWIPRTFEFASGSVLIRSSLLVFDPVPTIVCLAAFSLALALGPLFVGARWVEALMKAERQHALLTWQLKQFVSDAAQLEQDH